MAHREGFCILRALALTIWFSVLMTSLSLAQLSTTGTISGVVTDTSGAAIPDAAITITNDATGETRTTATNTDGTFAAAALTAGRYSLTVTKQGFQTHKETEIIVHPALVASVSPVLKLGEVSTAVEVAASATHVETATPEISGEVTGLQAQTLPLNGRNFQAL